MRGRENQPRPSQHEVGRVKNRLVDLCQEVLHQRANFSVKTVILL